MSIKPLSGDSLWPLIFGSVTSLFYSNYCESYICLFAAALIIVWLLDYGLKASIWGGARLFLLLKAECFTMPRILVSKEARLPRAGTYFLSVGAKSNRLLRFPVKTFDCWCCWFWGNSYAACFISWSELCPEELPYRKCYWEGLFESKYLVFSLLPLSSLYI